MKERTRTFKVIDANGAEWLCEVKASWTPTPVAVYDSLNRPMPGLDPTRDWPFNYQGMALPLESVRLVEW